MKEFSHWMGNHQAAWRKGRVTTDHLGTHNGCTRSWILPPADWEEGLWPELRTPSPNAVATYLATEGVGRHTGCHNLKSSWIACVNLYFPFRESTAGKSLLAGFLQSKVSNRIRTVDRVELEYAEQGGLDPASLLGELGGSRGSGLSAALRQAFAACSSCRWTRARRAHRWTPAARRRPT